MVSAVADGGARTYLRPVGLLPASQRPDDAASGFSGTLPLCGGAFDFSAIEIVTRNGPTVSRRLRTLGELWESDAGPAMALEQAEIPKGAWQALLRSRIVPGRATWSGKAASVGSAITNCARMPNRWSPSISRPTSPLQCGPL